MEDLTHQEIVQVRENADVLISEQEIKQAINQVAQSIESSLDSEVPVMLCVMKGGLMFTAALMQRISLPMVLDYVHVDRYRNNTQGSSIHWHKEPDTSLKDQIVIIVDDILDEGYTLQELIAYCHAKGAKKVLSAVLLKKKLSNTPVNITPDFIGLEVTDRYVFGWGMDYKGYLRNLSSIYAINKN
ncbi:MAG: hypoxanthine-guanine phosphoribosyltransferase [Gammaproteobacteria bacterium]|nr:MAG: hypoxanthine-guanine phosphoribosyltransferase [Gammaproteobacteria bacterium]